MDPPVSYPSPPPGWIVVLGELVEDGSVLGAVARREQIRGTCQRPGCWRRCELDLQRLVESGFGRAPLAWAKTTLVCPNMDGCRLQFKAEYGRVLRLEDICQPGVTVRFQCLSCGALVTKTPRALVAHIRARGKTDPAFREISTVAQLKDLPRGPCKACGKALGRLEVRWPAERVTLSAAAKAEITAARR